MCLWNVDSNMSTRCDTCTSGLTPATLDFRLPFTSGSIGTSYTELLNLENVEISLLSLVRAEIYVISYLLSVMAAIFDLRHTQTSDSIPTSLSVLPNPKNTGIAVGISLLKFPFFYSDSYIDNTVTRARFTLLATCDLDICYN